MHYRPHRSHLPVTAVPCSTLLRQSSSSPQKSYGPSSRSIQPHAAERAASRPEALHRTTLQALRRSEPLGHAIEVDLT